ncbi:methyltransferase [Candidatus Parvarchaeota archaeon]|nr:methyltransferase [Candidatus Parvarchaeota archaeon]
MDKTELSRCLTLLKTYEKPKIRYEQYQTDVRTAVDFLLLADSLFGFKSKRVADFGCGNGILGLGAGLLGAEEVHLYDIDENLLEIGIENCRTLGLKNCVFLQEDFFDVKTRYDLVISNPPFGIQTNFSLISFIKKLRQVSDRFIFIYKDNEAVRKTAKEEGLLASRIGEIRLKRTERFHKKEFIRLPVLAVYHKE